ncbi:hypothetical protein, partial [Streptococcus pyogenes]|uniref:hypothetical protein n=1 Tax=Streptococcus pyogenes TaxID=1314 RepID=UPI00115D9E7E
AAALSVTGLPAAPLINESLSPNCCFGGNAFSPSVFPTFSFLAHTVLGPIGWTIGKGISFVVLAGLTGPVKWLFGAIFGALYA